MKPALKNTLAVISGVLLGGALNMGIIMISSSVIPPPEGADVTTMKGLKASMHLFEPRHFLMPFLAHSIGTLVGALITATLAVNNKMKFAIGVSVWYLIGGIMNVFMLPSPLWFSVTDLVFAYLPMGFIAGKFVTSRSVPN